MSFCTCDAAPNNQPHHHQDVLSEPPVLDSILGHIGNTPMVRLSRLAKAEGIECEVLAKCEFFNAGGSTKDRIALRILEEAEKTGKLKPGSTVIEATSGNTGIGLAMACAVKGYKCIVTMPMKMSQEKSNIMQALGAEVIRTPNEARWDSDESHIGVANKLHREIEDSVLLGQYASPYNPVAHYDGTGEEILRACNGRLDSLVLGVGTGGTISGIARKVKEKCPQCLVVGVDPVGSTLAQPDSLNHSKEKYMVEGIGHDFVPMTLNRELVDRWVKCNDEDAFGMTKRLIKEEGLLCGGSSGAIVWAACEVAKDLGPDKRVVTLLPDSIRNYMTSSFLF